MKKIIKDKSFRSYFFFKEQEKFVLKSLTKNTNFSKIIVYNSGFNLIYGFGAYKTKLVNRCVFSGRKGKISPYFRFSRLTFLNFVRNSFVPGVYKSPW